MDISILQPHISIMKYSESIEFPKGQYEASKFETVCPQCIMYLMFPDLCNIYSVVVYFMGKH